MLYLKVVVAIFPDVVFVNGHEFVSIWSLVFVIQTYCMTYFMYKSA